MEYGVYHSNYNPLAKLSNNTVPIAAAISKMSLASITGNILILKCSEKTPLAALVLARLTKEAGFPPGIINVVSGYGRPRTCEAIVAHMKVRKVGFTGSCRTGRLIKRMAAASNLKRVSLELGGKGPLIIFPDADLAKAVSCCEVDCDLFWPMCTVPFEFTCIQPLQTNLKTI